MDMFSIGKSRKASLSLSVNAIVILIIALTVLGLILGFVTSMIGKTTTEFEKEAGKVNVETATGSTKFTISDENLILSPNEEFVVKFSVFNGEGIDVYLDGVVDKAKYLHSDEQDYFILVRGSNCDIDISQTTAKYIGSRNAETTTAYLTAPTTPGNYLCSFELYMDDTLKSDGSTAETGVDSGPDGVCDDDDSCDDGETDCIRCADINDVLIKSIDVTVTVK